MKIFEVIEAKKLAKADDDFDDVMDKPEDPEADKIPHILMQLRKAIDVDGDYPITFKDGKKVKLSLNDIGAFVKKYMNAKPLEKEEMQNKAASSLESFMSIIKAPAVKKPEFKIKGNRYMSHFGDEI
jgi:hypothetical protein